MGRGYKRGLHHLSAATLKHNKTGNFADGGGLYLQVTEAKDGRGLNRSWLFRYKDRRVPDKDRWMGLGSCGTVSLLEARERARQQRLLLQDGIDPLAHRYAARAAKAAESAKTISFEECARAYVAAHGPAWRSAKHAKQWSTSLARHVFPVLGRLPVGAIDTPLVLKSLKDVWDSAPETGSRLRGRIEAVLDWATAAKYRQGDNPARWSGLLEHLLPALRKAKPVVHLKAMPFAELPTFMAKLRGVNSVAARALEFLILTSARTGEVFGATWSEIDLDGKVWMIAASRMKGGRPHEVPLSARCIEILKEMAALRQGDLIFPGRSGHNLLAAATFRWLLAKLAADVTVHGFRSAFRDWCGERTNFAREIAEAALAHQIGNRVERAYRRGTALEQRRRLMEAWAQYCASLAVSAEVVPLSRARP
jgi:integrase